MNNRKDNFPNDLLGMIGGKVQDDDATVREIFFPLRAYSNLIHVARETASVIEDPMTRPEDITSLQKDLHSMQQEIRDMECRILHQFLPSTDGTKVDHGAKNKIEKGLADAKARKYCFNKHSKTLRAVFSAFDFFLKNGRMPSSGELRSFGYNHQQVCDAGKWLKMINLCEIDSGEEEMKLKDARERWMKK